MKELKNDIYDDDTFLLSINPVRLEVNEIKEWLDPENQNKIKELSVFKDLEKVLISQLSFINQTYKDGDQHFRKDEVIMEFLTKLGYSEIVRLWREGKK